MPIPDSQLETWSHQGAVDTAQSTHLSLRLALKSFTWPMGVNYADYLQGSYKNTTNIRGNSDVDLVAELTSTAYSEMPTSTLGYGWHDFRRDVVSALTAYYGSAFVDSTSHKSIKVLPLGNRLRSDVVVCATYRSGGQSTAAGMVFWATDTGEKIVNYPKLHYDNGCTKQSGTSDWYKKSVRMFKNARDKVLERQPELKGHFPSYFLECVLFNVPNNRFGPSWEATFINPVMWLHDQLSAGNTNGFMCQNGIQRLLGSSSTQWRLEDAARLVGGLVNLWNDW